MEQDPTLPPTPLEYVSLYAPILTSDLHDSLLPTFSATARVEKETSSAAQSETERRGKGVEGGAQLGAAFSSTNNADCCKLTDSLVRLVRRGRADEEREGKWKTTGRGRMRSTRFGSDGEGDETRSLPPTPSLPSQPVRAL